MAEKTARTARSGRALADASTRLISRIIARVAGAIIGVAVRIQAKPKEAAATTVIVAETIAMTKVATMGTVHGVTVHAVEAAHATSAVEAAHATTAVEATAATTAVEATAAATAMAAAATTAMAATTATTAAGKLHADARISCVT